MNGSAKVAVRLKVSPEVARIVRESPRDVRLSAARGDLPLSGEDLLTTLFFLVHGQDAEVRTVAAETVRTLPVETLAPVLAQPSIHSHLLDFVAQLRLTDLPVMEIALTNPAVSDQTLLRAAARADAAVLALIARDEERLEASPELLEAILANPQAGPDLKSRLGGRGREAEPLPREDWKPPDFFDQEGAGDDRAGIPDVGEEVEEVEEVNLSKYKMALQLEVAEKIKLALTGDKEWRTIFLKDNNKLVSSAVLKNPRITEGEVLGVAKNKSAHDELIRLITLNQEWIKSYEIQKALVYHPRTPLPKALRYMNVLTPKDLKSLAKSRGVSQVLVNNARRIIMAKEKSR